MDIDEFVRSSVVNTRLIIVQDLETGNQSKVMYPTCRECFCEEEEEEEEDDDDDESISISVHAHEERIHVFKHRISEMGKKVEKNLAYSLSQFDIPV
jgi:hypothetical protein